jgi:hypothetical protein
MPSAVFALHLSYPFESALFLLPILLSLTRISPAWRRSGRSSCQKPDRKGGPDS